MSVPFYPFLSLLLKLPNKGMDFPFPPLKLSNKGREGKGREKYFKMIFFIHFYSIPFPPSKRSLKLSKTYQAAIFNKSIFEVQFLLSIKRHKQLYSKSINPSYRYKVYISKSKP